ncbi:MAG: hemin uptake protein HemP [Pseudomonadota bacterium]
MTRRDSSVTPDDREPSEAARASWAPGESVDSRSLLGDSNTVTIRHGEVLYTLRQTRAGKLILTK